MQWKLLVVIKRAVEGGHYDAIFELAMRYEEGRGVCLSLTEAVHLYKYARQRRLERNARPFKILLNK